MRKTALASYALFLAAFVVLSYLASQNYLFPGEATASRWLQGIDWLPFHAVMLTLTFLGNTIPSAVIVTLGSISLLIIKRWRETVFIVVVTGLASAAGKLLKLIVARPRPDGIEETGFPSGHTLFAMTFYGFLFYITPQLIQSRIGIITLRTGLALVIVLTGLSRVYLGEHWPADVLGSLILGGLLLAPAIVLYERKAREVQS